MIIPWYASRHMMLHAIVQEMNGFEPVNKKYFVVWFINTIVILIIYFWHIASFWLLCLFYTSVGGVTPNAWGAHDTRVAVVGGQPLD